MGSLFSLGSPILDIHMVKPRLGTGVPRSPESNAPISSLYAPPHFPRNQPVLAAYSGQYFLSFSFSFLLPHWESEEKKTEAASRAWEVSETWVGNDEEQLLELEGVESEGSVRALEDDSDDEPEDNTAFLNLANFPVPNELSEGEEGGGAEKGEKGSKEGGEEESGDSDIDVPLAQRKRKVARV